MSSVSPLRRTLVSSASAAASAVPARRVAAVPHWAGLSVLLLGLWTGVASAQIDAVDNGTLAATSEAPGRVGRVGELQGQVWWYDTEAREWAAAERNRPLVRGDRLSTEAGARAELTVGSTLLRIDGDTEFTFEALDDSRVVIEVLHGSVQLRLRHAEAADEWTVRTADGEVQFARVGSYRIDQREGSSHLTVQSGEARFATAGLTQSVLAGQRGEFWRNGKGRGDYSLTEPQNDSFSAWVQTRERLIARSVSAQRVPAEMTGVDDLDRYGDWRNGGEHGELWFPREVPSGWAPYSQGQWRWVAPWGWTWVDAAPWGFAPFHYGSWVQWQGRWGWAPGARGTARAVFSPGLVVWGKQGGVSFSIDVFGRRQVPTPGWRPMNPHEVRVMPPPRAVVVSPLPYPQPRREDDRRSDRWPDRRDDNRGDVHNGFRWPDRGVESRRVEPRHEPQRPNPRDEQRYEPRNDQRNEPRPWLWPRMEQPRTPTPRVDAPRADQPRADLPRIDNPRVDTPRIDPMRRGERGDPRRDESNTGSGPALGRGFPPAMSNSPVPAPSPRMQQPQPQPVPVLVMPQPTQPPVLRSNPNVDQPREDNRGGRFPRERGNEGGGASPAPGGGASMPSRGSDAGRVWGSPQREVAVGGSPQPRAERQPMGLPQVMNEARNEARIDARNSGPTASADANNARAPGNGGRNEDEWLKRRRGGGGDSNGH